LVRLASLEPSSRKLTKREEF